MQQMATQALAAVAQDPASGAVEIAERAAEVLIRTIAAAAGADRSELRSLIRAVGWSLIRAHPTMAPLVNLVNNLLWSLDDADAETAPAERAIAVANDFRRRLHVHEAAIAELTLPLIEEQACILTIGRSTTVRAALRHAQRAGRRPRVICCESRPIGEGRQLAAELAADGIHTTLIVDALAAAQVERCRLVLVGADHVDGAALANKAGTYAIALAAQAAQVPSYALCSSEKIFPPGYTPPAQARRPADQVWDAAPAGVMVLNYYFDRTPLHLFHGIVLERAVAVPVGVEALQAARRVHRDLAAAVSADETAQRAIRR
jgi:translation initiation factor 2B subunit (eIF-2B alpha/beta/delta family)